MNRFRGNRKSEASLIGAFAAVLLAFFFAGSAILVLLFGAREYESTVRKSSDDFSSRTLLTYITEKIHHNDSGGNVSIRETDGIPVLVIEGTDSGTRYETLIYEYDDSVRELTVTDETGWQLDAGEPILEVKSFKPEERKPGLLYFDCLDSKGERADTYVYVRSAASGETEEEDPEPEAGAQKPVSESEGEGIAS
ncbi:DUF4860 domain-containing protein [Bilifractor sp. LCP19S3_H10]|uniref:DUF4860 domain-containing protein n=1 Tax=Bilifractor sp. LCP19S3_H10 TaxID=3438736 RepID=UPI003F8E8ED0